MCKSAASSAIVQRKSRALWSASFLAALALAVAGTNPARCSSFLTQSVTVTNSASPQMEAGGTPRDIESGLCDIPTDIEAPPIAPPDLTVAMLVEENVAVISKSGVGFHVPRLRVKRVRIECIDDDLKNWSGAFTLETQDRVSGGKVTRNTQPTPPPSGSRARVTPGIFLVSLASSSINTDRALFVGAAKPAKQSKLSWKSYRIQLTHVADGGHFCTPAATASVLTPRIGAAQGRLFVVFDSMEQNFTVHGSILVFDVKSLLRGGPVQVKCFTGQELKGLAPPNVRDDNKNAYFVSIATLASAKRFKLKMTGNVANDTLTATPDINLPFFNFNPAAVQPNGFHLYSGGFGFQTPSIQIGNALWNVHQIGDDGGHAKVRLYKLGATATDPLMMLTLATLANQTDDVFAPSADVHGSEAFVTFTRTIASNASQGNATLMLARGPHSSTAGWTSTVLAKSPGQFDKNSLGQPCDSFIYAGCQYGPASATVVDPVNNLVWGFGEIITTGTLGVGGAGNEVNWQIKGVGVAR
jgi:hypothetical protein